MIPNIKKFNDVEENFIKTHLTEMCFKDTARKNHQEEESTNYLKYDSEALHSNHNLLSFNNSNNNLNSGNNHSEENDYLQRKKNRNGKHLNNDVNKKNELNNSKKVDGDINCENPANQSNKNISTVGIKLICDGDNEDLKKYFSKTVHYILYLNYFRSCILMMTSP